MTAATVPPGFNFRPETMERIKNVLEKPPQLPAEILLRLPQHFPVLVDPEMTGWAIRNDPFFHLVLDPELHEEFRSWDIIDVNRLGELLGVTIWRQLPAAPFMGYLTYSGTRRPSNLLE